MCELGFDSGRTGNNRLRIAPVAVLVMPPKVDRTTPNTKFGSWPLTGT
jgi:hypothetical protein